MWDRVRRQLYCITEGSLLTQHLDGLPMVPLPVPRIGTLDIPFGPPQLPPNEPIEEAHTNQGQEEIQRRDPGHCLQETRLDSLLCKLTFLALHLEDKENRGGRYHGDYPESHDNQLNPLLGDQHLGLEREANSQVAFHAEGGYVENGSIRASLAQIELEAAQEVPKHERAVPPEAVEVKGQASKDQDVRKSHAREIEVGGGPHLLALLKHKDGGQVPEHS